MFVPRLSLPLVMDSSIEKKAATPRQVAQRARDSTSQGSIKTSRDGISPSHRSSVPHPTLRRSSRQVGSPSVLSSVSLSPSVLDYTRRTQTEAQANRTAARIAALENEELDRNRTQGQPDLRVHDEESDEDSSKSEGDGDDYWTECWPSKTGMRRGNPKSEYNKDGTRRSNKKNLDKVSSVGDHADHHREDGSDDTVTRRVQEELPVDPPLPGTAARKNVTVRRSRDRLSGRPVVLPRTPKMSFVDDLWIALGIKDQMNKAIMEHRVLLQLLT